MEKDDYVNVYNKYCGFEKTENKQKKSKVVILKPRC